MYSVTPLKSGYTLELISNTSLPRILVTDSDGVICESFQYEWWEGRRAEKAYNLMVALAGGPVGESVVPSLAA